MSKERRGEAYWVWISIEITIGVSAAIALIGSSGITRWAVIILAILGFLGFAKAAFDLGILKAPVPIGGPIRALIVFGAVAGAMGVLAWKAWPKEERTGFNVSFRVLFINMSRSPRTSAFFGFLSPWGLGQQLSPVALLSFINIENLYPFPVAIKSYAMSIRSGSCGWTHLAPIDSRSGKLLFLHAPQSPDKADAVLDTSNALDRDLRNPIAEHDSREGVLLFDTPSRCEAKVGDVVKLRLEIKDSDGAVFSYESSDLLILPGPTSKGTARRTTNFAVTVTGVFLDTSRVIRRNYSDPAPPYMNMDQFRNDVAVPIRVTSSFSLSFPDGTYIGSRP